MSSYLIFTIVILLCTMSKTITVLIAHNLRSCHNVGSLLRTAEGLGVKRVYLTGYTPYPTINNDTRLPHQVANTQRQIHKTALGAENIIDWEHHDNIEGLVKKLRSENYQIIGLEQTRDAILLPEYSSGSRIALIVGREVEGIEPEVLDLTDLRLAIPMDGLKESFNVVQAAAIALYHCRYVNQIKQT